MAWASSTAWASPPARLPRAIRSAATASTALRARPCSRSASSAGICLAGGSRTAVPMCRTSPIATPWLTPTPRSVVSISPVSDSAAGPAAAVVVPMCRSAYDGIGSAPGKESVASLHVAVVTQFTEGVGRRLQRHDGAHRGLAGLFDRDRVPPHDALPARHRVALVHEELEALTVQLHGVDTEVSEHAVSLRVDDD